MISKTICKHYKRKCDKKAPCCQIYYPCRLCHDENYKGPKSEGCKIETMDRYNVKQIKCRECQTEQIPSQNCENCKIQFARYYCNICKLFDNERNKKIFHCDQCNMCRRGKKEEFFHCPKCDVCLALSIKDTHKCIEKAFEQNCAVCQENLKISTKFIQQMENCPHYIHINCLNKLMKKGILNCPLCNVAIQKMQQEEIQFYDQMAEAAKNNFDEQLLNKLVNIICMDCQKQSNDVPFNIYLKCPQCGSYNTKE